MFEWAVVSIVTLLVLGVGVTFVLGRERLAKNMTTASFRISPRSVAAQGWVMVGLGVVFPVLALILLSR
jgi:hypothetical protein